ncbi:MAG: 2-oxoglutarate and iron-dependent oxygenase domain-containing protein [Bacteroidia bacterium]
MQKSLPIIDIAPLVTGNGDKDRVAQEIATACRAHGFFYISGHGVPQELIERLERLSREFFSWPNDRKLQWPMSKSGKAWRGFFPLGGELTSGKPDWKEGLYLGTELPQAHPLVQAGTPLHGPNLFPDLPGLRETILEYMDAVTKVGHALLEGVARSLGLEDSYFADRYTADPLILFRIFNYPSQPLPADLAADDAAIWGVGEHTDYGLLTLLYQDAIGGLQVKSPEGWIAAPPVPGTFICNIGDMLDRMTGGLYKSTPHRVRRNDSGRDRLSFPLFFDPNFFVRVQRIAGMDATDDSQARWDRANVHAFSGTYGDYVLDKVGKVFPELRGEVLD